MWAVGVADLQVERELCQDVARARQEGNVARVVPMGELEQVARRDRWLSCAAGDDVDRCAGGT
jgi:hypothetical protein